MSVSSLHILSTFDHTDTQSPRFEFSRLFFAFRRHCFVSPSSAFKNDKSVHHIAMKKEQIKYTPNKMKIEFLMQYYFTIEIELLIYI